MIRADQIPYEIKRAMRAAWARRNDGDAPEKHMADLMLAGLGAWPGMRMMVDIDTGDDAAIKLPLPQEVIPKRKKTAPKRRPVAGREGNNAKVNIK